MFLGLLLGGCAGTLQSDRLEESARTFPEPIELTKVPFFPQEAYECGPAALATLLNWTKVAISPEALAPQVYLPARQGSLQLELIAAARRHGRVPYPLKPALHAVFTEVAAGHPVLVLQNLGLSWYPRWHYAVVVGFDIERRELVLRSGTEQRHVMPIHVFERTWARGDYWSIVVLPPNQLPRTAEELPYLQAVLPFERMNRWQDAASAYATAKKNWPNSLAAQLGLGNSRYALGDLRAAETAFRQATERHPQAVAAWNNLAQVLLDRKKLTAAERAARRAVQMGGPLQSTAQQTLDSIHEHQRTRRR